MQWVYVQMGIYVQVHIYRGSAPVKPNVTRDEIDSAVTWNKDDGFINDGRSATKTAESENISIRTALV